MKYLISVQQSCPTIAVILQVAHVVNIAWIMNLSIEVFLRLSKYIHTSSSAKFAYACFGWILPAMIPGCLAFSIGESYDDEISCWKRVEHLVFKAVGTLNIVMILVSIYCLGYTHILYNREKKKYEPYEWQKFW
ncbi:uncharacterized protein [Ptychodera flava]|uniref:uncharacterized protein n=1 Tax=Ptychodera flava TaxID=63121 RepID=UPI00396A537B